MAKQQSEDITPGCFFLLGMLVVMPFVTHKACQFLVSTFAGHWVGVQVLIAYGIGLLLARLTHRLLCREMPLQDRNLGCLVTLGIPMLFYAVISASSVYSIWSDTLYHNQPGWGKADLVTYRYATAKDYLEPLLVAVVVAGWGVTSLWLCRKPVREDRDELSAG